MKKSLRFVAVALLSAGIYATATAPKTNANPITKGQTLTEGSAPVPMCRPGTICE